MRLVRFKCDKNLYGWNQFWRYETKCARTKTSNRYEKDCTWHEKQISFDMKKILKKILRVRNKLYKYETIAMRVWNKWIKVRKKNWGYEKSIWGMKSSVYERFLFSPSKGFINIYKKSFSGEVKDSVIFLFFVLRHNLHKPLLLRCPHLSAHPSTHPPRVFGSIES